MWLAYGWFGVRQGDRVARFWGAPFATRRRWVTRAADYAMNRIRFSAFAFSDDDLEQYWARCIEFSPDYLHGYVSMLDAFAGFLERRGYDGTKLPLKSIIATSEALTAPQRERLERVFGAPVQIEYGCGEAGPIGYTCERGGFHLMAADLYIELINADGEPARAGEPGEVILTDLNNLAMPLVRYRLGDFAVAGGGMQLRPSLSHDRKGLGTGIRLRRRPRWAAISRGILHVPVRGSAGRRKRSAAVPGDAARRGTAGDRGCGPAR